SISSPRTSWANSRRALVIFSKMPPRGRHSGSRRCDPAFSARSIAAHRPSGQPVPPPLRPAPPDATVVAPCYKNSMVGTDSRRGEGGRVVARSHHKLTRRERQIMDIVYRRGEATVSEVLEELPEAPTYSAVRAMLRKLEEKGHLTHDARGARYIYRATLPRERARQGALERLMRTFFDDSASKTVAALLDLKGEKLGEGELEELERLI